MKYNDVVIVPDKDKNRIHIGIVGDYQWMEEYKPQRMAHYREVKWLGHLQINQLNELVQNFLKLPSTVHKFKHPIREAKLGLPELLESANN
jgi:predicted Mrr-cat superfamily restriction endonuclease